MTDRYQHLLDSLAEEVVVIDQKLRIAYANPAWLRRVGLAPSQVLNQNCYQVVRNSASPCASDVCVVQHAFKTGQPARARCPGYENVVKDDLFDVSVSPVFDDSGQVSEVIQVLHTIGIMPEHVRDLHLSEPERMQYKVADALREAVLVASAQQGLQTALDAILKQLHTVVNYDSASIVLLEAQGWRVTAGRGFPSEVDWSGLVFPRDDDKLTWMESTCQPMVIHDVRLDEHWRIFPGFDYIRSWIGVPLLIQGRMIGALNLDKSEPDYYQSPDARLVMAFANQAAVVIENARLLEAERQRVAQLALIEGISQRVLSILEPDALLSYAVSAIQSEFGYYHVDVFLTEPNSKYVVFKTCSRLENARDGREHVLRLRIGEEGIIGHVAATGQPYIANDVSQDPHYLHDSLLSCVYSEMSVPIKVGDRILGVLDLNSDQVNAFSEDDLFVAQGLADQLALGLENARLFEESRKRSIQLEAAAEVSRGATAILDVQQLLDETVRLIPDRFGFYHAGVFLVDEKVEYAVLRAASSEGGQRMLARGHKLPVGQVGIVGYVAGSGEPRIALDVGEDAIHFVNPDLPDTRSEMALPLISRGHVIGVLDVQSIREAAFTEADVATLQTVADQLANAIENARLFEETRRHVEELTALHAIDVAIASTLDLDEVLERVYEQIGAAIEFDSFFVGLYDEETGVLQLPIITDHGERLPPQTVHVHADGGLSGWVVRNRKPLWIGDVEQDDLPARVRTVGIPTRSLMILPLVFRDKVVGILSAQSLAPHAYDEGYQRLFSNIAGRVAIAVENARLYEETQQRLSDLTMLFDASAAVSVSLDADKVLLTTAQQTLTALRVQGCSISAWDQEQDALVTLLDYGSDNDWWEPEPPGTIYPLAKFPVSRSVLTKRTPTVIQVSAPDVDPAELAWMLEEEVKTLLMVPVVVGGKVIGLLELMECEQARDFTATEIRLCETLANQAGAALENARLFQETQARVRELSALTTVGQAMTTLELDQVLDSITKNAQEAMRTEFSSVYLTDKDHQLLLPRSVQGEYPSGMAQVAFRWGEGTIGWVAESGKPLIVHDVSTDPVFVFKTEISEKIRNTLTVPLIVKDQVIGTLEVCNKIDADRFTTTDQRLLSAFAAQAAVAIDNARLYQEVSLHLEEVLLLNKVAEASAASLDLDDVIRHSMEALLGIRNFERIHVCLVDEASGDLWIHPSLRDLFDHRDNFRIPVGKGITGQVAITGEPMRIDDVRENDLYIAGYPDTLSELAVPLLVGDRIVGVLDAQSTKLHAFTENDQRLLATFASQLSTALNNVRLFEETQLRVRELTALTQVSQALYEATDLDTILNVVLGETFELVGSSESSILLIDPPGSNQLCMVAERGLGPEIMAKFNSRPVYTHEGTYRRALSSGQIVEVTDTSVDPDFLHDVGSRAKRVTNIPMMTEGGAIGLIAIDELPKDDTTRRLLIALAGMAAVAIDKERLHSETIDRLAEVSTLYTLSNQITSSLSSSLVLESIVTILRLTLDCRACSIFLLDQRGEYLRLEAASGPSSTWKGVARLQVGEGVSGRVITERRSIYIPDTHAESDFIFFDPQIRSLLSVPLVVRDEAVGTLSIDDTRPNAFDNEVRLLTIAAAQAAVAIENAQLYESLQNSYTELEQAYHELRELDKMKSEFVQTISHELRTPLTFIKGYVELLQDGDMGELNEEQLMALRIVADKASSLSRLVDDIISLQQASRERMEFDVVSLAEVGHQEIQAARASATQVGLRLCDEIPDGLPPVLAEKQRLCQVFHNLLGNAIKFSNPDDTVTVRMFEDGDKIRTEVQDTGIGIPEDKLSRIFDRFYQVDSTTTRRFGGTGLGLAITKQIVEAHGGQVGVESRMDEGSTFWFTIPIVNPSQLKEVSRQDAD